MCSNCYNSLPLSFNIQSFLNTGCSDCGDCLSTKGICYQGPALPCSGVATGDSIEVALSKIDEQICSAVGDYNAYQKNCLPQWFGSPILDEATFVDAITSYTCTIATNLQTFTGTTFPQYQTQVASQFASITGPSLTCASAGVTSADNLFTILTKYCTKFGAIDTALNVSTANWSNCFSVGSAPITVLQGFNEVLNQLCQVKALTVAGGTTLPTFNNIGSCLPSPTTTDSLVSTIGKIKTVLCATQPYVGGNVDWGCLNPPDETLEGNMLFVAQTLNNLSEKSPTFSDDFVTALVDADNPCAGMMVSLATPINNNDRLVAYDSGDTSPGTLIEKIVAGLGIELGESDDTNQMLISSTGVVAAHSTDGNPAYLIDKLEGSTSNGFTITPVYNPSTQKVTLSLNVDPNQICQLFSGCLGNGAICSSYTVTPVGANDSINYVDCDGNTISLTISGATTFCAQLNTIYAPASTIVNTGRCSPNPNTSGFLLINNSTNVVISSINTGGSLFYTITDGAYPVPTGSTLVGVGVTSSAVRVVVASGSGQAKLYKNNILQQTLALPTSGTYTFTAVTFAAGDSMKVVIESAP